MDVDQYFRDRADLIVRVLTQPYPERSMARDRWLYGCGLFCLVAPLALVVWASKVLIDPGYFSRFSWLMAAVFVSGVFLLSVAQGVHLVLARAAIVSRNLVIERTLGQLLKLDHSLAYKMSAAARAR